MLGWAAARVCFGALQPRHCSCMQPSLQPLLLWPGRSWQGINCRGGRGGQKQHRAMAALGKKEAEMQGNAWQMCEVMSGC